MFMKGFIVQRRIPLLLTFLVGFLIHTLGATTGLAQETSLSGILDIAFGSTKAEAQTTILLKGDMTFDPIHSDGDNLVYDGGTLAGQDVGFWVLGFVDNQMHTGKAIIQPSQEHLLDAYDELLAVLTATYGEPTRQAAYFDDPYEMGDGFETYAISFGKGHFAALWKFSDGDNENALSISINKDLYIPIVFQSGRLIDLAIAKQESTTTSGL